MITSLFSADRAVMQGLRAGATATMLRELLGLEPGAWVPIYRGKSNLVPAYWPHVVIWKTENGVHNFAGVPRLMRDDLRVVAVMRDDQLNGRAMLEDVLEPLAISILVDLCALTVTDTQNGGQAWRSHILNPRFEMEQPPVDERAAPITVHQLGSVARFLSR